MGHTERDNHMRLDRYIETTREDGSKDCLHRANRTQEEIETPVVVEGEGDQIGFGDLPCGLDSFEAMRMGRTNMPPVCRACVEELVIQPFFAIDSDIPDFMRGKTNELEMQNPDAHEKVTLKRRINPGN